MDEKVFLYSVTPTRTITGLKGVRDIKTAKSLYLTKEDVKICLKKAFVYRRFEDRNEKVTIDNLDRLHNENYIEEKDWNGEVKEADKNSDTVVEQEKMAESVSEKEVPKATTVNEEIVDEPAKGAALDEAVDSVEVESDDEAVENSIEE